MTPAERDTAAVKARLERIYGRVPATVYVAQMEPGGPVKIGRALRIGAAIRTLHRESDEVKILAVVPGGQPLQHWFRKRQAQARGGPEFIEFAHSVGYVHASAYAVITEPDPIRRSLLAGVAAVRRHDLFLADFERLYRARATYKELAESAGLTLRQVQATLDTLRALGFEVEHRRVYGRRTK